jgi:hypothetical protein
MALTKGTNSYVTLAEADSYFSDRLDVAAWSVGSETQKQQALITATSILDTLEWTGIAVSDSQSLAFPRIGTYFDPRLGKEVSMQDSLFVTQRINTATFELAYHLLNNDGLLDNSGSVIDLQIGTIELRKVRKADKLPQVVKAFIKPLMVNRGSNSWWRAN